MGVHVPPMSQSAILSRTVTVPDPASSNTAMRQQFLSYRSAARPLAAVQAVVGVPLAPPIEASLRYD